MSLRDTTTASRVRFSWWGTRKALTKAQKERAAQAFNASARSLSAGKLLIDTAHPAYKRLTDVKGEATDYWKNMTLPYVEDGVRLLRRDQVTSFVAQMEDFQQELAIAATDIQLSYESIKTEAVQRLGELHSANDYPATISDKFSIAWEFPSVEPPNYLQQLNPALYEQERARVQAHFQEAKTLAEQAFASELRDLVTHIHDVLEPGEDGRKKTFRDTAVTKLKDFFQRFRDLSSAINEGRNEELDALVEEIQAVMRGVTPSTLRRDQTIRDDVHDAFAGLQERLGTMIVAQPRRNWQPSEPEPAETPETPAPGKTPETSPEEDEKDDDEPAEDAA